MKKLPTVFICFEQCGDAEPEFRDAKLTKEEAQTYCKVCEYIPHSGWWFYKPYTPKKR